MVGEALAICHRCGKKHYLPFMSPGVECDCHLYCSEGTKPGDCTVTEYNYSGPLAWPFGSRSDPVDEGDDLIHATGYCSTHNKYVHKDIIFLEVDWEEWNQRKRIPAEYRLKRQR